MPRLMLVFLFLLAVAIAGWLFFQTSTVVELASSQSLISFVAILAVYGLSHMFRMFRLVLLSLDQRRHIFSLTSAHALTAFPSSLLPFKLGEFLRLGSFFYVFNSPYKAMAVWLAERFGDISVISILILLLYVFEIEIPAGLSLVFPIFLSLSALALLSFYAATNVLVYINRHLILSSYSKHGLTILKFSHKVKQLQKTIYQSVEGRLAGVLLISCAIWLCEILAIWLFVQAQEAGAQILSQTFWAVLAGGEQRSPSGFFAIYQSLLLVFLALVFAVISGIVKLLNGGVKKNV